ncbi:MAG: DUF2975 domain-containing protein [Alistipes sp.]|nr:DUF2975 domain-containing protein [Alistipes sp.]
MQNKRKLHKHLLLIYIIYCAALTVGFLASFVPGFSRGWQSAQSSMAREELQGKRTYYVSAQLLNDGRGDLPIAGLSENVAADIDRLQLHVSVPEEYTPGNIFKVLANSSWAYLMLAVSGCSYLAIFVLIALIINSLRKSIRDEQPIRHSNIARTRAIGILILAAELCQATMQYINNREAAELLAGTSYEVALCFPIDYWNLIDVILFLFMAEVFSIGTQLSEEQKLTI